MPYTEIPISLIDPSPFQTRIKYDKEVLAGIATTSMDELGIRTAPIVRPHPDGNGRYQIASGHGRVAAWKTLGHDMVTCRVEKLTDSQMKKEILVENVNRSDLNESERMVALEQYKEDLSLDQDNRGFYNKLSVATGIPEGTIRQAYDVKKIRESLKISARTDLDEPSAYLIRVTGGLPEETRLKLIVKALDRGWSARTAEKVKVALRGMDDEIRNLILDESTKLTHKVITTLLELDDAEKQKEVIHYIREHKLNEDLALKIIEQVKEGPLVLDIKVFDEVEEVFYKFNRVYQTISSWGYNEYMIVRHRWGEVLTILDKIEAKIGELKAAHYEQP